MHFCICGPKHSNKQGLLHPPSILEPASECVSAVGPSMCGWLKVRCDHSNKGHPKRVVCADELGTCLETSARKLEVAAPQRLTTEAPAGKLVVATRSHLTTEVTTQELVVAAPQRGTPQKRLPETWRQLCPSAAPQKRLRGKWR